MIPFLYTITSTRLCRGTVRYYNTLTCENEPCSWEEKNKPMHRRGFPLFKSTDPYTGTFSNVCREISLIVHFMCIWTQFHTRSRIPKRGLFIWPLVLSNSDLWSLSQLPKQNSINTLDLSTSQNHFIMPWSSLKLPDSIVYSNNRRQHTCLNRNGVILHSIDKKIEIFGGNLDKVYRNFRRCMQIESR